MLYFSFIVTHTLLFMSMQTISSGRFTGNTKRPQDTKEARVMALLSYREVVGLPEMLDISHARAKARASADLLKAFQSRNFLGFTIL